MKLEEQLFQSFFYPFIVGVILSAVMVILSSINFTNNYLDEGTGNNLIDLEKKYSKVNINAANIIINTYLLKVQAGLNELINYYQNLANKIVETPLLGENIDDKFFNHLIRGYLDGDGTIGDLGIFSDPNISIVGFESNMIKIKEYLERKNIFSSITIDKRKYNIGDTGNFVNLCLSNKTSKYCFLKLIYKDCEDVYMDRKYENSMKYINYIETSNEIRDKQIVIYYKYAVQPFC